MRQLLCSAGVCLLVLMGAVGAAGQSLNCDNPTRVIPDGRLNGSSIPAGASFWFSISTSQALASYSVEANFPQGAATMPNLLVLLPGDVGAGPTCAVMSNSVTVRNTTAVTPEAPNGQRFSFQKTTPGMATFLIRVGNAGGASEALSLRVSETTQFHPGWSTGGGGAFNTFYSIQNTTNSTCTATLKLFNLAGTEVATTTQAVAAGALLGTNTSALGVGPSLAGTGLLTHDCPPGGIFVDAAIANFSTSPAAIIPSKFQELRAAGPSGGGEGAGGGGGGVQSVTAGDASIAIGGTVTDPTVAVADSGITTAKLANASVTAQKLAMGVGGSVTTLTEGTGIDLNPDTITEMGTIAIDTTVVPQLGAPNTFAATHTLNANLALPNTTSDSVGVLTKGGVRFLHDFGSFNTFVGTNAGNFTLSGGGNSGFGGFALMANTTGFSNSAFGFQALQDNTAGTSNSAFGHAAMGANTTGNNNSAFGVTALVNNTTGFNNTAVGAGALSTNTTASNNTAVGASALLPNTATGNTAVGAFALDANTTGTNNTALGLNALGANGIASSNTAVGASALLLSTGGSNTAVGAFALDANTTAGSNTAVGNDALGANTTGLNNTAVGKDALFTNTTGQSNAALGVNALRLNTASNNTAVGAFALDLNTTGTANTAVGADALGSNGGGSNNTAVGSNALGANTEGVANSAFGNNALRDNTTGNVNSAFGNNALLSNTEGIVNSAFGSLALRDNTTGNDNSAFGATALSANTTANSNSAFGSSALRFNTTGFVNAAFGVSALLTNTTGNGNAAFGAFALQNNTTGANNAAFGRIALRDNTTGANNSAFGDGALQLLSSTTSASNNVAFGFFALNGLTSGDSNIALGMNTGTNLSSGSNNIYVGNPGVDLDSGRIRIGTGGTHTAAFIAGISGVAVSSPNTVVIDSNGQLGTVAGVATGTVNSVGSGDGLTGGPITTSGNLSVNFGGPGAATSVARSDHTHALAGTGNTGVGAGALGVNVGMNNTALGTSALAANTGLQNTGLGTEALTSNTFGGANTGVGYAALMDNISGNNNTAVGSTALVNNSSGGGNTAVGVGALTDNNGGSQNTAVGKDALKANTAGHSNTAVGLEALVVSTGQNNVAIGFQAGANATTGNLNIYIGNPGLAADSSTIRIGTGMHTSAFVGGVRGVTTGIADTVAVLIDSAGQLGTVNSTRRVKEDIRDMGEASAGLLRLRPVLFRYKKAAADGSKPLQYGLIAEEVAEVMPELVVFGADGQPQTVQYHVLPALLLNELQRQQAQVDRQEEELASLRQLLAAQAAELAELKAAVRRQAERASR